MKSTGKSAGKGSTRPDRSGSRSERFGNIWLKAFVWVLLAIFVLTSVGVALVVTTSAR